MTASLAICIELGIIVVLACLFRWALRKAVWLGKEANRGFDIAIERGRKLIDANERLYAIEYQRMQALRKAHRVNAERRANHKAKVRDRAAELRAEFPISARLTIVRDE